MRMAEKHKQHAEMEAGCKSKNLGKSLRIIAGVSFLALLAGLIVAGMFGPVSSHGKTVSDAFISYRGTYSINTSVTFGNILSIRREGILENSDVGTSFKEFSYFPVGKEEARKAIITRTALLDSIFIEIPSPYPGELTQKIECPLEFLPETFEYPDGLGKAYYLPAGERRNYGVCSNDLVKYHSIYVLKYCKGGRFLEEIQFFSETSDWGVGKAPDLKEILEKVCAEKSIGQYFD